MIVHGAWHRPKVWEKLETELHALGYRTHAPALPSAGERPTAGMHDDAAVVAKELASTEGPVVLLAHSYGGIPVTEGAAGAPNVERLIYLCAWMPDEGQSLFDLEGSPTPDDVSGILPVLSEARTAFYGDMPDAEAEQAMSMLVEQTIRSFAEKVGAVAWRDIPSTYVVAEQDQAIPLALQEKMAAQAAGTRRLTGGHSPFLAQPRVLAALVDEIVRSS
ncbi:alpha/beta hydrolase [Nonomuraea aridisoli]|uniref:Alpha/beta hydrolase n=2 Tax=Nonomuraea aridisoli TaxID=2070368 RepID=A0A2W2DV44_9ACTN|nr:alpha/beta hydrolase [Nonomuraea aridisoli]